MENSSTKPCVWRFNTFKWINAVSQFHEPAVKTWSQMDSENRVSDTMRVRGFRKWTDNSDTPPSVTCSHANRPESHCRLYIWCVFPTSVRDAACACSCSYSLFHMNDNCKTCTRLQNNIKMLPYSAACMHSSINPKHYRVVSWYTSCYILKIIPEEFVVEEQECWCRPNSTGSLSPGPKCMQSYSCAAAPLIHADAASLTEASVWKYHFDTLTRDVNWLQFIFQC